MIWFVFIAIIALVAIVRLASGQRRSGGPRACRHGYTVHCPVCARGDW